MFRAYFRENAYLAMYEQRHAEEVFAQVEKNRDYLRQWMNWVDRTKSVDDVRKFIETTRKDQRFERALNPGIWVDGRYVGGAGMPRVDLVNRHAEIGYWIDAEMQGKGIVTDACRALINYAFDTWEMNRIFIHCATGNERSCATARRLGFVHEGVLRGASFVGDQFLDINVFGMLKTEWPSLGELHKDPAWRP